MCNWENHFVLLAVGSEVKCCRLVSRCTAMSLAICRLNTMTSSTSNQPPSQVTPSRLGRLRRTCARAAARRRRRHRHHLMPRQCEVILQFLTSVMQSASRRYRVKAVIIFIAWNKHAVGVTYVIRFTSSTGNLSICLLMDREQCS